MTPMFSLPDSTKSLHLMVERSSTCAWAGAVASIAAPRSVTARAFIVATLRAAPRAARAELSRPAPKFQPPRPACGPIEPRLSVRARDFGRGQKWCGQEDSNHGHYHAAKILILHACLSLILSLKVVSATPAAIRGLDAATGKLSFQATRLSKL